MAHLPTRRHSTRPPLDHLSVRDIRFCQHYAEGGNATEAYRRAGYPNSHSSDAAIRRAACDRLTNPHVRRFVRDLRQQAADAAGVTLARVAQALARVAFADRTAIFDTNGRMRPPHLWPEEVRAIVAGVDLLPDPSGGPPRYRVRFPAGIEALKVLAEWRGMIGRGADRSGEAHGPLVIGGEVHPDDLSGGPHA